MNPTDPALTDARPPTDDVIEVGDGDEASPADPDRPRFWTGKRIAWSSLAAVAVIVLAASGFVTVGQVAIAPGGLHETERRIEVDGTTAYPSEGEMLFATVSVREVTFWGWLQGKLDDDIKLLPREQVYGERDPDENARPQLPADGHVEDRGDRARPAA